MILDQKLNQAKLGLSPGKPADEKTPLLGLVPPLVLAPPAVEAEKSVDPAVLKLREEALALWAKHTSKKKEGNPSASYIPQTYWYHVVFFPFIFPYLFVVAIYDVARTRGLWLLIDFILPFLLVAVAIVSALVPGGEQGIGHAFKLIFDGALKPLCFAVDNPLAVILAIAVYGISALVTCVLVDWLVFRWLKMEKLQKAIEATAPNLGDSAADVEEVEQPEYVGSPGEAPVELPVEFPVEFKVPVDHEVPVIAAVSRQENKAASGELSAPAVGLGPRADLIRERVECVDADLIRMPPGPGEIAMARTPTKQEQNVSDSLQERAEGKQAFGPEAVNAATVAIAGGMGLYVSASVPTSAAHPKTAAVDLTAALPKELQVLPTGQQGVSP